jgi:membrane protease YdiL (CAAX protease family)
VNTTREVRRLGTGWRIAIVLAGTVVIWTLMVWIATTAFGGDVRPVSRIVCALLIFGLAVTMVILARRFLDQRPWRGLGIQGWRGAWRPFLIGAASFLVPSVIGLAIALLTGWLRIAVLLPPVEMVAAIAFTIVTVLLLEAVPEELIFRGYIYRNLSATIAPIAAVFVQAILFAFLGTALWVATTGWEVLFERAGIFLGMGVVLGLLRVISGSVWNPIGFHLGFQVVAQTLLVHPGIDVSNQGVVTISGIIVSFVFATTVTLLVNPRRPNWQVPEPDEPTRPRVEPHR